MATLVLSAEGMALGGAINGTVAGLATATIGRAAGAMVGRVIDQRLMSGGSAAVETGRVDRFRLTGANEGAPIGQVYGRMRVGGHVIWATRFQETSNTTQQGGKGAPSASTTNYSYTVSLAIALCEGEVTSVGRIWADGAEIAPNDYNFRVYSGAPDQQPDPKITAVEGAGNAPAFRGTAYIVFEDLPLEPFGNRVPQFSFEVTRPSTPNDDVIVQDLSHAIGSVALMPGSGEYTLATTPVFFDRGFGNTETANVHTASGLTDMATSLETLTDELPNCESTSLIVSWFGDDLRAGQCELQPKVEQAQQDGTEMPWVVSGLARAAATEIVTENDRPVYGGTPADASVIEAIAAIHDSGQDVMFYPFILMDQLTGNGLPNPWNPAEEQPYLPWRGRITTSIAPGQPGSPDQTNAAQAEVDAFFGTAQATDFTAAAGTVLYTGPSEWSYRRFILHYAHLCAQAGGVAAFCIGSEMRGLTHIRDGSGAFIAVQKLIELAADVRTILGPDAKISYAADWSEYFGYQPQDGTNDRYFHLDPLWSDTNIDFIGIDNYMPLSDWRDGCDHKDIDAKSIYNLSYLMGNVEGGEGFDWYYETPEAREAQNRTPIQDASESEPWAFRYKDIRGWWENPHYNRVDGVRSLEQTAWVPESKPIWFTEIGCAAIDKGTNQPNKFLDPKSSESSVPRFSNGQRDELIQMQYLRAMYSHWKQAAHNPTSNLYDGPMLDLSRAHVWAWDARPYPAFPNRSDVWSDAENYATGHWISGRTAARPLDSVVREICARSGLYKIDTTELYGYVRGYGVGSVGSARQALQPLMTAFGFDAVERDGVLIFKSRTTKWSTALKDPELVVEGSQAFPVHYVRDPEAELADRVRLSYIAANGSFEVAAAESVFPTDASHDVAQSEVNLMLTRAEARQITDRWLAESRSARDRAEFVLPPSDEPIGAGDIVTLQEPGGDAKYRIDRLEHAGARRAEAVRVDGFWDVPIASDADADPIVTPTVASPVFATFMDLPMMSGSEVPFAPHAAVTANPWPGHAAMYASATANNFALNTTFSVPATLGFTTTPLAAACHGIIDHGLPLGVQLTEGVLDTQTHEAILAGANLAIIGDGTPDNWEVFQFEVSTVTGQNTFEVTKRLRGQFGSDGLMPAEWPAGSHFVLLNGVPDQIDLPEVALNVDRTYRVGPGGRPYNDPLFNQYTLAFKGNGRRPYAPAFLNAKPVAGGLEVDWIRRTRGTGDGWDVVDVPVSEATEAYRVKVWQGGNLIREAEVSTPQWIYSAADITADGVSGAVTVQVAQLSQEYGPGLFAELSTTV